MNTIEAKILHGLYYHREMVDEPMPYTAAELNWLAHASWKDGRNWQGPDGKLKASESEGDDYLAQIRATSATAQRPLRYLEASGYVNWNGTGGLRIAVTAKGADVARELDSALGRMDLFYKEHKDGLIWFLATVLVSLITALAAK